MKTEYLPHIDILRAIAVLLVIFNHLNITLFSGGFIGVDIFFVISGYLITKNIQQEVQLKTFSLLAFYQRRVVRLAPAFFTVLACCTILFWQFSTQLELYEYFKSLIAATTFSINIYFWQSLSDYFSIDAHTTPLLHIWSLSLEEQFYLIWPTLFLLIIKLKPKIKLGLLFIIFSMSFLYSFFSAINNPIFAYYLLPTRFFEFMVGALLVLLPRWNINKVCINLLGISSLALIFILSIKLNKESIFPSYNALFVCFFSAIYIYFAKINESKRIWQPILYLGKISYPMYLWHWPIIVAININSITLSAAIQISIIISTFVLAAYTYERIEKPARKIIKYPHIIKVLLLLPLILFIFISTIYIQNFNQKKIFEKQEQDNIPLSKDQIRCVDRHDHPLKACIFGDPRQEETKILLLGDSHANAQRGFIDILAKDAHLKGYELTYTSSLFLPNLERFEHVRRSQKIEIAPEFRVINDQNVSEIKTQMFKYVILGGYFPHNAERNFYSKSAKYFDSKESHKLFTQGLNDAIQIIINNNSIPVIINDNPKLQNIDINCNLRTKTPKEKCFFSYQQHEQDFKDWLKVLKLLQDKYPQLIILDFTTIICPDKVCYSYLNNVPLYRDSQHLTYSGSTEIGQQYLKKYGNPLKSHEK